jgi:ankyrin repeat protein
LNQFCYLLNQISLRRCPGPNTTDSCGYSCLHHAALNGHKDIVELLLSHDANPNIVDNKGSTALHLAAWTGDYEIVNMLLTQSSHVPNVNLKNNDNDTALIIASQYGHTSVVSLLLQKGSDPTHRNVKDESALDLAAQYGRADTVELFLRTRPSLVRHLTAKHSPLHLASRNGHKNVVKMLIDAKFDVNFCTETGSALHEAALFGKIEVVKLLLNSGIDIELEDCHKRTVLDLLNDLNTHIAKQTKKLIREHSTLINADLDDSSTLMSDCSSHCISPPPGYTDNTPEHHYNDQTLTDGIASPAMTSASEFSFYEAPPPPRLSIRSSTGSEDYK